MRVGSRWQKPPTILLSVVALVLWTGCVATPSYVVTLHDGRVYRSAQEPLLDTNTGYYKFRDRYGRDVLLRDREVSAINEDPSEVSTNQSGPAKKRKRRR